MKTIIFDLDGTLAIINERREKATLPNGKMDWETFFDPANIELDKPNVPVIDVFRVMAAAGYRVGVFSGRDAISYNETLQWLQKYEVNFDFIRMRPIGSNTPDDVLKKQWLDDELNAGEEILCVFDDRDKVVKMWRDNGITCMQVNYGDF
jgi:phosphoglycolate phosphatase-like HAD superfamily hydrolase